jgi:peptidoglycan hydrolase CwlO-like protein
MKKKILCVFICMLLITTSILSISGAESIDKKINDIDLTSKTNNKDTIFNDGNNRDSSEIPSGAGLL